jgi:diguanylate cyclase (GGDEF)-like protein
VSEVRVGAGRNQWRVAASGAAAEVGAERPAAAAQEQVTVYAVPLKVDGAQPLELRVATSAPATGALRSAVDTLAAQVTLALDRLGQAEETRRQARIDALTGLPNRAGFEERLEQARARSRRTGRPLAAMLLDLDQFQDINDTFGHAAGDALLCAVAARLQRAVRAEDVLARLGGDEFALLADGVDEAGAAVAAERILACFAEPFTAAGHPVAVRASLGVVVCQGRADACEGAAGELVRRADVGMYQAKRAGKRCYRFYDAAADQRSAGLLEQAAELQAGIRGEQLEVWFQPIVRLGSQAVVRYEALVRWRHPRKGLLAPAAFIDVAERTGLIVELDRWVLRDACGAVAAMAHDPGAPAPGVSVNVSAQSLHCLDLVDVVAGVLAESGLAPGRLTLELTETELIDESEAVTARVQALRDLGVRVALDDFGSGYAAFAYLRRLPVDELKIDRSLLDPRADGQDQSALLRALVDLARALSIETVGEGVETAAQRDLLAGLGCVLGQGYLFGRPAPWAEPAIDGDEAAA